MKYRVKFDAPKGIKVYEAEEGIYFDDDVALEAFDLIKDELTRKADSFSVEIEKLADCPEVIVIGTLKKYVKQ